MERYHNLDPERSLSRWVSMLHRLSAKDISKRLEDTGVGRGQFIFLAELFDKNNISQDELAEALHMDKGTTARAVQALEQAGYVNRVPGRRDRRVKVLSLTEKALGVRNEFFRALSGWTEVLTRGFTPAERRQAFYLLYRMTANAERETLGGAAPENEP